MDESICERTDVVVMALADGNEKALSYFSDFIIPVGARCLAPIRYEEHLATVTFYGKIASSEIDSFRDSIKYIRHFFLTKGTRQYSAYCDFAEKALASCPTVQFETSSLGLPLDRPYFRIEGFSNPKTLLPSSHPLRVVALQNRIDQTGYAAFPCERETEPFLLLVPYSLRPYFFLSRGREWLLSASLSMHETESISCFGSEKLSDFATDRFSIPVTEIEPRRKSR